MISGPNFDYTRKSGGLSLLTWKDTADTWIPSIQDAIITWAEADNMVLGHTEFPLYKMQ